LFRYLDPALAGVFVGGAARVSGESLRNALCNVAIKAGAKSLLGSAVLAISENRIAGTKMGDEFIPSDAVVVAAGAWSAELCRALGVALSVQPQRGQILHLKVSGPQGE
jgi:D-amino-acid dehydrogenase